MVEEIDETQEKQDVVVNVNPTNIDVGVNLKAAQAEMLQTLDNHTFTWYHVKAILVSGIGFFTDAYDLFVINLVVPMIGYAYYKGNISTLDSTLLKGASVIGTFIGQILFGVLGDKLGRKTVYGWSLLLMVLGALASCVSASTVRGMGVVAFVCWWRLVLGIGIGGDYPLSAVITSEYSSKFTRGRMIAAVFSFQGWGNLLGAIVSLVVLAIFQRAIEADPLNTDYVWRIVLGLGIVPAITSAYFRAQLPETPRYTMQVERDAARALSDVRTVTGGAGGAATNSSLPPQASQMEMLPPAESLSLSHRLPKDEEEAPKASWSDFCSYFSTWDHFKVLFGCSVSWFMLDIAFYGLNLNQSVILNKIGYVTKGKGVYETLYLTASGNAIISLLGNLPGYWFTIAFIEIIGRRRIQFMGFGVCFIVFVILAAGYNAILEKSLGLFIFLYCVAQFFFNFGPNSTTFIIPGEVFPTRYKTTGHGICAATGKLGAIIATYAFQPISNEPSGVRDLIAGLSVCMFLGFLATFLVPETKGKSLEQLNSEGEGETESK